MWMAGCAAFWFRATPSLVSSISRVEGLGEPGTGKARRRRGRPWFVLTRRQRAASLRDCSLYLLNFARFWSGTLSNSALPILFFRCYDAKASAQRVKLAGACVGAFASVSTGRCLRNPGRIYVQTSKGTQRGRCARLGRAPPCASTPPARLASFVQQHACASQACAATAVDNANATRSHRFLCSLKARTGTSDRSHPPPERRRGVP